MTAQLGNYTIVDRVCACGGIEAAHRYRMCWHDGSHGEGVDDGYRTIPNCPCVAFRDSGLVRERETGRVR